MSYRQWGLIKFPFCQGIAIHSIVRTLIIGNLSICLDLIVLYFELIPILQVMVFCLNIQFSILKWSYFVFYLFFWGICIIYLNHWSSCIFFLLYFFLKVFEIDDVKVWRSILISVTSYALGLFLISKALWLLPYHYFLVKTHFFLKIYANFFCFKFPIIDLNMLKIFIYYNFNYNIIFCNDW